MHRKTRTRLVSLAACAFVAGMLALPGLLPDQRAGALTIAIDLDADAGPEIRPAGATGNKALIVILLKFTDKSYSAGHTPAYYQDLLFNFGNPLSMASYYREVSYGRLNLTGMVTPWFTSSRTMSYYGADSGPFPNIDDQNGNIFELAKEAVQLADPTVNFAPYDQDGDGYIDNLVVIHAGEGQESSGVANDIWSHQWEIWPAYTTGDSGKKAEHYALFSEDSPVGVIAHEFGHVLGLPDMYDYTYSGQVFVGRWALMDAGSWNGDAPDDPGDRPSHMMGWSKMKLGFITPAEREDVGINEVETVTIIPTHRQALPSGSVRIAVINISTGVYYTVEVRNNTDDGSNEFDQALPDSGVLITFCNDSAEEEVFYGRPGVCVVQNAKPSDTSKDHAPFDLGPGEDPQFDDPLRNIKVRILSKNATNGAYTVEISHIQLELVWMYVNGSDVWQTFENHPFTLNVTLRNTGTTTLTGVMGTLSTTTGNVTVVPSASRTWGSISPGTQKNCTAAFDVSVGGPIAGTPMNFTLTVTASGMPAYNFTLEIPVQKEVTNPLVSIQNPTNATLPFQALEPISISAPANDTGGGFAGIFKVWYRYRNAGGSVDSWWVEMDYNGSVATAMASIRQLGNFSVVVRAMDNSGNIAEDAVTVVIIDTTPPSVLLSVNLGDTGDPSHFIILGAELSIVAVAIDNNEIAEVDISINGGEYNSILGYPATVNMGVNGTDLAGYAYPWTPSIEGDHLIRLRARDASGNEATTEWQITAISPQTITTIIVIVVIIIVVFSVIANLTRRRHRTYRTRYYYRY
ncbi:MAG: M6 family metalloprotease domain-containing protein [Candidatus Lokiarchaeota archaeon]|nr:M6 family metalloprotease domain-containing protein [Candidatus Lokiarchaeota archaeon]